MVLMTEMTAYNEAQNGLISALLYLPGRVKDVIDLVNEDDFDDGRLRTIWKAIVELDRRNETIEYASVVSTIYMQGKMTEAGGIEEIQRLFNDGAISASMNTVDIYAQVVKNESAKRNLLPVFNDLADRAHRPGGNAKKLIETGRGALDSELIKLANDSDVVDVSSYFDDYTDNLNNKMKLYKEFDGNPIAAQNGIPSGFPTIDKNVGGFLPGQVVIVGARTGVGKSFLLTDLALNAAHAGAPVLFFNLEMLPSEIMDRLVAANYNIRLSALRSGALTQDEFDKVLAAKDEFKKLPIEIDSTPNITVDHIRARAQQKASSPGGLGLIIIDYLQLVTPSSVSREDNRQQQVAEISRNIKLLSMKIKIPVIQAVQLNRIKRGDENPTPRRDDIRESNSIAQDASVIILIDRARDADGKTDDTKDATFILDKNRNGPEGKFFKCHTLLKYARFEEVTETVDDDDDPESDDRSTTEDTAGGKTADNDDSAIDNDDKDVFDDEEEDF
jgi:replicative DNA helicase